MYFVMHVSRLLFLMVFGSESGCKTKHFAKDVLQKLIFAEVGILMIPGSIFHDFECVGPICMTFVTLETGLKFNDFHGQFGALQILRPFWWKGTQGFLALDSTTIEAET